MKKILSLIFAVIISVCSIFTPVISFASQDSIDKKAVVINNNESKTQPLSYGETVEIVEKNEYGGVSIYDEVTYETVVYYKFTTTKQAVYDFILTGWNYNEDNSVSAQMNFCDQYGQWDNASVWLKGKYDEKYKTVAIVASLKANYTYYIKVTYNPNKTSQYKQNKKVLSNLTLSIKNHEHRFTKKRTSSNTVLYTCDWCGGSQTKYESDNSEKTKSNNNKYSISKVKLSKKSYTYDKKVKTPSVIVISNDGKKLKKGTNYKIKYSSGRKQIGKYSVKIIGLGKYKNSKTVYFTINPKGTNLTKLTAGKKSFKAHWNKQKTQISGYQIQYSTSSSFKNAKTITITNKKSTSKTKSKLKAKKKYYVRVRTYRTVNAGKGRRSIKIYSNWSKAKFITTKK